MQDPQKHKTFWVHCNAPVAPPVVTQSLSGHIYDCTGGTPTSNEVTDGTIAATGPTLVVAMSNPWSESVNAGSFMETATSPAGFHFIVCGGSSTLISPTSATDAVIVPAGGPGVGIFYLAANPTTPPPCASPAAMMSAHSFLINGHPAADMSGAVQGDTVVALFTIEPNCSEVVSLVAYRAPSASFSRTTADQQVIDNFATGTFGAGSHQESVTVPGCFFQVDFVTGAPIIRLGPDASTNFYGDQNRLIDAVNGGNGACAAISPSQSPTTSPSPSTSPSPAASPSTSPSPSTSSSPGASPSPATSPSSGTSPVSTTSPTPGTSPSPATSPSTGTSPVSTSSPSPGTSPGPTTSPSSGASPSSTSASGVAAADSSNTPSANAANTGVLGADAVGAGATMPNTGMGGTPGRGTLGFWLVALGAILALASVSRPKEELTV